MYSTSTGYLHHNIILSLYMRLLIRFDVVPRPTTWMDFAIRASYVR
jgi:hypothetical protein